MRRSYGHLRGIERRSDKPISQLFGEGFIQRPSALSYVSLVDRVRDQGATSSCEAQAATSTVFLRAAIIGAPIPHPSAMALYGMAREIDQGPDPLKDEGTYARSIAAALARTGVVSETSYPFDEAKINQRPPWDVVQKGSDARIDIADAFWIRSAGKQRCEDVRQALSHGFPLWAGMDCTKTFEDGGFGVYDGTDEPSLGGHAIACVGYGPDWTLWLNSWSASWNDGGYFKLSDRFVGSDAMSDFCTVHVTPRSIE